MLMQTQRSVEMIPAARRLMSSLRDMGYEFPTAVADLVDNSVEAGATKIAVDIEFEGEESWVRISDNGKGMSPGQLREAMRYGSARHYGESDLGKFGLGMKVASLSQCQRLTVASRTNPSRAYISAYSWDLGHIETTNRWELLPIARQGAGPSAHSPLRNSVGTVVLWQRLDRILGYEDPHGQCARRRLAAMCRDVEGHLAMVFHRFLSGEAAGRRKLEIQINGRRIEPWDPFARSEPATRRLEPQTIKVRDRDAGGTLVLEPFILPHQADFSDQESFRRASGPANWNQQQGFYVYRSDRLIQCGGWCRIRTLDEHTKLARVALRFSPQLDDAFRVNVSKMRVQLPAGMREPIMQAIAPVTRLANDVYRRTAGRIGARVRENTGDRSGTGSSSVGRKKLDMHSLRHAVFVLNSVAGPAEKKVIRRVAARLGLE
jgi:hypothetical protein